MNLLIALLAVIAGMLSFFYQPLFMGIAAIILGGLGEYIAATVRSTATATTKKLDWVAIAAGLVGLILYFIR
ncbi:MAG: hypothetical protein GX133_11275 [Syntrophomonadaceae bacterium]|nr:hypothetical protein [Syntrophomonadaceae bacterium]